MANPKITGLLIGQFEGFTTHAKLNKAKRAGKDRVWFYIRRTSQASTGSRNRSASCGRSISNSRRRRIHLHAKATTTKF